VPTNATKNLRELLFPAKNNRMRGNVLFGKRSWENLFAEFALVGTEGYNACAQ
jgi:hypothetical protein